MKAKPTEPEVLDAATSLDQLYQRPGFMIRRAHQISIDMFIDTCRPLDLTPSQYGVMFVLRHADASSQIGIARLLGLDRSTTALVVRNLTERGFIIKEPCQTDGRKTEITLTREGRRILRRADELAQRSREELMEAFSGNEADEFMRLLGKFIDHFNDRTRVSLAGMEAGLSTDA
ncbi:MAG TPA: MarR family transcriptional regulator [Pararobbsia sp.]|jgi:DNA-binding MarR family transcriptional regulator|nr:MarR family transcriptional regulator [Pararobbsia sp.]